MAPLPAPRGLLRRPRGRAPTARWPATSSPACSSSRTARGISTASPSTPTSSTWPSATSSTPELHLYKVELWGKYAGAVNYDQPLHRDYGSHSLVVPRPETRYQQITTFIYLSDVTEVDAPTVIVPYDDGKDVPFTPLFLPFGELADREVRCVGPAGSLLVYRTDVLHRGSDFGAPGSLTLLHPGRLPGAWHHLGRQDGVAQGVAGPVGQVHPPVHGAPA